MPLGNGDISLNAWVDREGRLAFYVGKTDSWDENGRLLKLGLVRVELDPSSFAAGGPFRQELCLATGEMVVTTPSATMRVWVDANHPVVRVEVEAAAPLAATIRILPWRTERTELPSVEVSDIQYRWTPTHRGGPTFVEPDTVLAGLPEGIGWFHRNARSFGPELTMRHQGLMHDGWQDPLLHRTFGAVVRGDRCERVDDRTLASPRGRRHAFQVHVVTRRPATEAEWLAAMRSSIAAVEAVPAHKRRAAHEAWWRGFWSRSWLDIHDPAGTDRGGADVARGYCLQRFINACGGRGGYPIKYNGSIFTVPHPGAPGDADYRRWGPGYWWQNTRLPYQSMCTSGDLDLVEPLLRVFVDHLLPFNKHRVKRYFGFDDAAYYPECVYFWGPVFTETYGDEPAETRSDKLQESGWHKWEWVGGLELVHLMQDLYDHTGDDDLLTGRLLPTALPVLRFFDRFYKTGPDGRLVMHPSQAVETWWECTNPMPEVAGMRAVVQRLLALPAAKLPSDSRRYLEELSRKIPELPTREEQGERMLAPAERYADKRNVECPELYAVYPFRLVSFEKPGAELGVRALHSRLDRGPFGWRQEDLFMAYLGLAEEAREYVVQRARAWDKNMRFPAFWGPNYDWTPDQCHGGVLMKAAQSMLMQTEGRKILLLPAWPEGWDADFRLHAPYGTAVEGSVRGGKLVELRVEPESRRGDVEVVGGR
jgi:alpha-L-fucosidase 2